MNRVNSRIDHGHEYSTINIVVDYQYLFIIIISTFRRTETGSARENAVDMQTCWMLEMRDTAECEK